MPCQFLVSAKLHQSLQQCHPHVNQSLHKKKGQLNNGIDSAHKKINVKVISILCFYNLIMQRHCCINLQSYFICQISFTWCICHDFKFLPHFSLSFFQVFMAYSRNIKNSKQGIYVAFSKPSIDHSLAKWKILPLVQPSNITLLEWLKPYTQSFDICKTPLIK